MKRLNQIFKSITDTSIVGHLKALLKSEYFREIRAVHQGSRQYRLSVDAVAGCTGMLRRNIHRIEKGLIMRPRRRTFALDYIGETVEQYLKHIQSTDFESPDPSTRWFHDVLENYFEAVDDCDETNHAKDRFFSAPNMASTGKSPRMHKDIPVAGVSYTDFLSLCHQRRSVRWYLPDPVPRELINKALTAAALSPSACNRQPFVFHFFDDPADVRRVASIPMGTVGFSHQFPMLAVVIGDLSNYRDTRDRHVIYIDAALAAMSFMFALEALGLSSCPINWPDIEERESQMDQVLELPPYQRPVMLISIGFAEPEGLVPYSEKKSIKEISRYHGNHY